MRAGCGSWAGTGARRDGACCAGGAQGPAAPSPPLIAQVFGQLADGRFHSGETLADSLGVSRSAVWKAAGALRELGATVQAVRNRGYRLARQSEPLDARRSANVSRATCAST